MQSWASIGTFVHETWFALGHARRLWKEETHKDNIRRINKSNVSLYYYDVAVVLFMYSL